uniref:Protein ABHD18 n=1 Tax=Lygus hesperus TaxID=30085 RepID=A0A0K8THS9_LYGHE
MLKENFIVLSISTCQSFYLMNVKSAHFQMILPVEWKNENYKPICIHMAGTGDHFYWRRRYLMAKPLLEEAGIASIIVENPFYGVRKPPKQKRSILNNVLDIFTMGGCLIMEGMVLYNWCKKNGIGPVGFSGYSMGGHMASLAATSIPEPVVLVPCLSWSTASGVFTEGVMSKAIDWELLLAQYNQNHSFKNDIKNMVKDLSDDAFRAGQNWIKQYSAVDSKPLPKIDGAVTMMNDLNDEKYSNVPFNGLSQKAVVGWQDDIKKLSWSPENSIEKHGTGSSYSTSVYEQRFALLQRLNHILFSSEKVGQVDWAQQEAFHFMKGIMDECTHIANFTTPIDTSLIISVCAVDDGYVPRCGVTDIRAVWPDAEVRYVQGGHVTAFVLHQKAFRKAIVDAFDRYRQKYIFA